MVQIRPAHEEDILAVKRNILAIAYNIFGFDGTLEESIRHFESLGIFEDLENVRVPNIENKIESMTWNVQDAE